MCYPEIMNVNTVANQTDFFKRERQNFKEEVSMQRLQYVDEMSYKLERGLKEVKFHEIYDEWTKILRERGVYHPIWNSKNTASFKITKEKQIHYFCK